MTRAERQEGLKAGAMAAVPRLLLAVLVLVAGVFLSTPAAACEAEQDRRDDRIRVGKDGSFANANIVDPDTLRLSNPADDRLYVPGYAVVAWDMASDGPVRDRGNGRVAQRITLSNYGCNGAEALLFVDCTKPNSMLIFGRWEDNFIAGQHWTSIALIQPPHGPINVTDKSSVESLARTARQHGIEYLTDAGQLFSPVRKRDRYDVYLGCKLYYPGSPGAGG